MIYTCPHLLNFFLICTLFFDIVQNVNKYIKIEKVHMVEWQFLCRIIALLPNLFSNDKPRSGVEKKNIEKKYLKHEGKKVYINFPSKTFVAKTVAEMYVLIHLYILISLNILLYICEIIAWLAMLTAFKGWLNCLFSHKFSLYSGYILLQMDNHEPCTQNFYKNTWY